MVDAGIGDYFISDVDAGFDEDDELLASPIVVPVVAERPPVPSVDEPYLAAPSVPDETPAAARPQAVAPDAAAPAVTPAATQAPAAAPLSAVVGAARVSAAGHDSREERMVAALDALMEQSPDVQAAALVSLDGFTMASALPAGMQEDRVGAMSAAILGLGERAAAELGRGHLDQVFIEGADGYVLLMSAGDRAVLTVLADPAAKLGLVLYDMRQAADQMGEILR